jgi:Rrf2 family protein
MAHIGNSVEYALHCLLWLAQPAADLRSSRDLADLQGVPGPFLAKIFPKLEKAGIVFAIDGIRGGYRLGRPPERITVLDVVDAVEGEKPLFDCQEIRGRCALFKGKPPAWSIGGVCGIHAVMLRAQSAMREELARTTIAALAASVAKKAPPGFANDVQSWLAERADARTEQRLATLKIRERSTRPKANGDHQPGAAVAKSGKLRPRTAQ